MGGRLVWSGQSRELTVDGLGKGAEPAVVMPPICLGFRDRSLECIGCGKAGVQVRELMRGLERGALRRGRREARMRDWRWAELLGGSCPGALWGITCGELLVWNGVSASR